MLLDATIAIPELQIQRPARTNDAALMDIVHKLHWSARNVQIVYAFRLSARVALISDCVTESDRLDPLLLRYPPSTRAKSKLVWPIQTAPVR